MNVPLIFIFLLPLSVLYGFGAELGFPYIFWNDDTFTRTAAGA